MNATVAAAAEAPGDRLPGFRPSKSSRSPAVLLLIAGAHLLLAWGVAHTLRLPVTVPVLAALSVHLLATDPVAEIAPQRPAPLTPPPVRPPEPTLAPVPPVPPVALLAAVVPDRPIEPAPAAPTMPTALPAVVAAPAAIAPAVSVAPPPPAAAPAPPPERQMAISQVEYLAPPQLNYPLAARRLGEQGQVLVRVRVDEQGRPEQAVVQRSSGHRRLDDAALAAVAATRFKPYREGGTARPFWVVMPLIFELDA